MMTITKTGETFKVEGKYTYNNVNYNYNGNINKNVDSKNAWLSIDSLGNFSYNDSGNRISINFDFEKDASIEVSDFVNTLYNEIKTEIDKEN